MHPNSSRAKPKITRYTQCQYLQNRNCAEMPKITAHLKIRTHLPFQFSLCYYHKNEKNQNPLKYYTKLQLFIHFCGIHWPKSFWKLQLLQNQHMALRTNTVMVSNQDTNEFVYPSNSDNLDYAGMPKIAVHLKIRTHLPFQFSLCYYHKNEKKSKPSKILHKAPIVHTFLWYSLT